MEDRELEQMVSMHNEQVLREAQEKIDIEVACEVAKYRNHLKKVRRVHHIASHVASVLSGAFGVIAMVQFTASDTAGVLIATACTFITINLAHYCDKQSRKKKGED